MSDLPDPPVPMDELRAASTSALVGSIIGPQMKTIAYGIAAQIRVEEAELRLIAMTRPAHLTEVFTEVDRRTEAYAKAWRERPEPAPYRETPRFAALSSVADDVACGRLG